MSDLTYLDRERLDELKKEGKLDRPLYKTEIKTRWGFPFHIFISELGLDFPFRGARKQHRKKIEEVAKRKGYNAAFLDESGYVNDFMHESGFTSRVEFYRFSKTEDVSC